MLPGACKETKLHTAEDRARSHLVSTPWPNQMGYCQGYFQSLGVGGVGAPPFSFHSLVVGGVGAPPFSFHSLGVGGVGAPPFEITSAPLSFDATADLRLIAPTRINIDAATTASCLDIVPPRY